MIGDILIWPSRRSLSIDLYVSTYGTLFFYEMIAFMICIENTLGDKPHKS